MNDPKDGSAYQPDFRPGDVEEGPLPQRFAGSTLPADEDTAEAVSDRAARHIEMEGQ